MNKLINFLIVFMAGNAAMAQQDHFVYIQTDNHQAFYIQLNNKIFSSSETGYLILPGLADSSYGLTIGFPKKQFPEQAFQLPVRGKDQGLLLKNFGAKGWGLFNYQTLEIIMNNNSPEEKKKSELTGVKKTDSFSMLLSNVVNDSSILYTVASSPKTPLTTTDSTVSPSRKTAPDSASLAHQAPLRGDSLTGTINPAENKSEKIRQELPDSLLAVKKDPAAQRVKQNIDLQPELKKQAPVDSLPVAQIHPSSQKDSLATLAGSLSGSTARKDSMKSGDSTFEGGNNTPKPDSAKLALIPPIDNATLTGQKKLPNAEQTYKATEAFTDTSYIAVYVSQTAESSDTIRLSIPLDRQYQFQSGAQKLDPKEKQSAPLKDSTQIRVASLHKTDSLPTQIENQTAQKEIPARIQNDSLPEKNLRLPAATLPRQKNNPPDGSQALNQPVRDSVKTPKTSAKTNLPNSDCHAWASEADIDKLRVRMLAEKSDEEKIAQARKLFHLKCFTVRQVRALSELFTGDEGKYKWLDATYPFVVDSWEFPGLGELLHDEYFKNRFQAMIRH